MPDSNSYTSQKTAELLARARRLLRETMEVERRIKQMRADLNPRIIGVENRRAEMP